MDFTEYAIDYLNNNKDKLRNDFFSATFNNLTTEDIKHIVLNKNLNDEIRGQIACCIIESYHLNHHAFEELMKIYFLHKQDFKNYSLDNLDLTFEEEFYKKYNNTIDVLEKSTLHLFKLLPKFKKSTKQKLSIGSLIKIDSVNINDFISQDYDVVSFMLDIIISKEKEQEKIKELNFLFSTIIDLFTKPSLLYAKEETIENKKKMAFNKVIKTAKKHNFEHLLTEVDLDFICGEENENSRFSEFEIAARNFFPNDSLIKNMYTKKRKWLLEESDKIILRYSASIDLDDYSYIVHIINDIKNKSFKEGTRFVISHSNNEFFLNKYNIVEILLENGYFIDSINQKYLINAKNKKKILFKAIEDNGCISELNEILNGQDFFFVFSVEPRGQKHYQDIKDFIIENKDFVFDQELKLTKEAKELIELNFKY